jgi:hypothetical protein
MGNVEEEILILVLADEADRRSCETELQGFRDLNRPIHRRMELRRIDHTGQTKQAQDPTGTECVTAICFHGALPDLSLIFGFASLNIKREQELHGLPTPFTSYFFKISKHAIAALVAIVGARFRSGIVRELILRLLLDLV